MPTTTTTRVVFAAGVLFGTAFGLPAGGMLTATAQAQPVIQEDDPGWDCRADGNRICGPNNSQSVDAGCYNDAAALVAVWPCHVEVNPDGSADVYSGLVDAAGAPVECRDICLGA